MDGGTAPFARPPRVRRVLLVAGAVVLLGAAVGAGVALDRGGDAGGAGGSGGGAAGASGSGASNGGSPQDAGDGSGAASGAGGQAAGGGGGTGGASSPTTTSPATTVTTSTTVPPLRVPGYAANISSRCTLSPAGYYDYTARVVVEIRTEGVGILAFQWGRGAGDVRSPNITRDIPPERQGGSFRETDVISGRAPSAAAKVVDRFHILNPPADRVFAGAVDIVLTHSIC